MIAVPKWACMSLAVDRPLKSSFAEREQLSLALRQVAEGSRPALAEVYNRSSAKLFGICLRILGEKSEAEDALQDIYLNVWRKAGTYDSEKASPITWLAALARNRSIDRKRAIGARPSASIEEAEHVPDGSADAFQRLESAEEAGRVAACLGELEERPMRAIHAAFYDGLSYPELAERWSVPLGTMKSWVRRGLLRLRECLER